MDINFGLGNRRDAQVKIQSDMYNSILHNQKLLAHALKMNAARQQAAPAPAPAPRPSPVVVVPAPAPAPAPAPRPSPVVVVPAPVHKKTKFNGLLSQMNEQRKK